MLLDVAPEADRPVVIVPVGDAAAREGLLLLQELRGAGITADMGAKGNVGKRMKQANKANAKYVVLLGDDEIASGVVTLRDLDGGEQSEIARDAIVGHLSNKA